MEWNCFDSHLHHQLPQGHIYDQWVTSMNFFMGYPSPQGSKGRLMPVLVLMPVGREGEGWEGGMTGMITWSSLTLLRALKRGMRQSSWMVCSGCNSSAECCSKASNLVVASLMPCTEREPLDDLEHPALSMQTISPTLLKLGGPGVPTGAC